MSDETSAPVGSDAAPAIVSLPSDAPNEMSVSEAARLLSQSRRPKEQAPPVAAEPAQEEHPELVSEEANAAPAERATGEEPEATDPAEELPPLDPPRSWTKAEQERFRTLPRETQEYLHTRETERDREVRRTQNEAAEARKAIEAEREQAEKVRQEYEAKLPAIMQLLQSKGEFADIRSMDDVKKLQMEDPFRFQAWQLHQMELQTIDHELKTSEQRKAQEQQSKWTEHVQKENALVAEKLPEFADPAKAKELQIKAVERLNDLGFTQSELTDLASGKDKLSIYDHRVQLLIADSLKLADVQKAKAAVAAKPVPQVQRPGVARTPNASAGAEVQALQKQLANASGNKAMLLAAQLVQAQRRAAKR